MSQRRMIAFIAAGAFVIAGTVATPQASQAQITNATAPQAEQLIGVTIHAESGESLGAIDRVVAAPDGTIAQVVMSVAAPKGGHKLVAIPYGQLRFATTASTADVVAGYGTARTAAPGVTGPFGTAHLESSLAAAEVQPQGGPPGTVIVLPGASTDSLLALPEFK